MQTLNDVLALLGAVPTVAWAVIVGLIVSWGVTQRVKFYVPECHSAKMRRFVVQGIAFVLGGASTFVMVPTPTGAVVAFATGLASPTIWRVLMVVVKSRWPRVASALSSRRA